MTDSEDRHPDDLVDELVAAYRRELWPTVDLDEPETLDELRTLAGRISTALAPAIREHRLLTETELALVRRLDALPFARRLARHDLVRLQHVAPKVLHRRIASSPPEESRGARDNIEHYRRTSATVLGIASQIRTSLFESTIPPRATDPADQPESPTAAVLTDLVSGWSNAPEATRRRALEAGFVLGTAHVVASVEIDAGAAALRDVTRVLAETLERGPYRPLVDLYDGRGVVVQPLQEQQDQPDLPDVLGDAFGAAGLTDRVRAGIGRPQAELSGIRKSYDQSLQVLAVLREAPALGPAMGFDHALPYLLLGADPALSLETQSVVEPLVVHDQAEGTDLLDTLEAFLGNPGNVTEVSRSLHIHRHTLYNRMERIEELTGRALDDPDDRLLLELALRASRLLP